jgi:hypothetical protein
MAANPPSSATCAPAQVWVVDRERVIISWSGDDVSCVALANGEELRRVAVGADGVLVVSNKDAARPVGARARSSVALSGARAIVSDHGGWLGGFALE